MPSTLPAKKLADNKKSPRGANAMEEHHPFYCEYMLL